MLWDHKFNTQLPSKPLSKLHSYPRNALSLKLSRFSTSARSRASSAVAKLREPSAPHLALPASHVPGREAGFEKSKVAQRHTRAAHHIVLGKEKRRGDTAARDGQPGVRLSLASQDSKAGTRRHV